MTHSGAGTPAATSSSFRTAGTLTRTVEKAALRAIAIAAKGKASFSSQCKGGLLPLNVKEIAPSF